MGDSSLPASWKVTLEESSLDAELMIFPLSFTRLLGIHNQRHMGSWVMVADRRRAHEFAQTAVNVTGRASVCIVGFETLWRPHCSV